MNTEAIRRTAHDSGDGATVMHCPFCGGGQVVGRSDGTIECQYDGTAFTVQVQPMYSGFPQTVDGAPFPIPGMPGQVGGPPAAPGADQMMMGDPEDPGGANPFADGPDDGAPDEGQDEGNPFADGGQDGGPGSDGPPDGGKSKSAPPKKDKKTSVRAQPARYATASGKYLSPEAYVRYLAIRHALNRELDPLLEKLRRSNHPG